MTTAMMPRVPWPTQAVPGPGVRAALKLADNERIAGFVFIGTAKEQQADRERPALSDIVSRWHA